MKFLAGLVAAFLIAAGLSVGATSAATAAPVAPAAAVVSADPYGPSVFTFCHLRPLRAAKGVARVRFTISSNGFGFPPANVSVKIRNSKGKLVRSTTRSTRNQRTVFAFRVPKGKVTVSVFAKPRGNAAKRFYPCSARTRLVVR